MADVYVCVCVCKGEEKTLNLKFFFHNSILVLFTLFLIFKFPKHYFELIFCHFSVNFVILNSNFRMNMSLLSWQ